MDNYELAYRGNVKEFEDSILYNLESERQIGKNFKWDKFVKIYARQLSIILEDPYPESEIRTSNDETPPSIKLIVQNTRYPDIFYRWGLHQMGIGNFRIIYCVHDYYKVVLLHQFNKRYNGAIKNEDIIPAENEYETFCYEEPQRG